MNGRLKWGIGIAVAVLVAGGVAVMALRSGFAPLDRVSWHGSARVDEKLMSDIRQYREQSASLAPEVAAARWFELYDRAADVPVREFHGDFAMLDAAIGDMVGVRSMMASLPPPAAWPAFRTLATRRASAGSDLRALGIRFLGELLDGDRTAAADTLGALEKAGASRQLVTQSRSLLVRLYGDQEARVLAFREELRAADQRTTVSVPDLHAMVGEQRAAALLTEAIASPALLTIEGGADTRALALRLALANLERMMRPQWNLAAHIDGAPLYEALLAKFPQQPAADDAEATFYYFLRMVSDGRQADAERALRALVGEEDLSIPHAAVDALTEAQLNEPLYRFLHAQLQQRPALRVWDVYIEQAAYTGHSRDALQLIDRQLARRDLEAALRADLRERRTAALLAADQVDAAASEMLARFATPPARTHEGLGNQFEAAVEAAAVGRLIGRKDLADTAIAYARAALLLPPDEDTAFELTFIAPQLYAELRKQRRDDEALQIIQARIARSESAPGEAGEGSDPDSESFDFISSFDQRPGLVEMAAIHSAAGRHEQVLELLASSEAWGEDDLAHFLNETDSLRMPLGAVVARSLRATGDEAGALRVANATTAAMPAHDAAYEVIAALDSNAPKTLDARFALDEYEERPLIWKASFELAHGARDAAEATIRRAIAIDPSDGEEGPNDRMRAYAVLAEILRARGDVKQAALYEGAVRAIRMSEQADELHRVGLYQRALVQYRMALDQFSDAYCIQSRLAVQLNRQGRRVEALEHYRRAYELMPSSFGRVESHCFGCENVFVGADQQGIAEHVFNDVIRRAPKNAQAHYLLAYLREQQGRYAEAVQPLRAAVSLDDHYLNAWKRLQDIANRTYVEAGERDIARLKLLELDPMQRHGGHQLTEVGSLAALWHGAARAHDIQLEAAPPGSGVYPLGAAARVREARFRGMSAEMRAETERMEQAMSFSHTYLNALAPPPAAVLGEHVLVTQAQALMGLETRRESFPIPVE